MKRIWTRITNWELWPFFVIYAPLGPVWLYYAIKARHFWFVSPVNPTLEFSGFEGESKREMYEQLPKHLYPRTIYVDPTLSPDHLFSEVKAAGFQYPILAKPDVGMKGMLMRKIKNEAQLEYYHRHVTVDYVIQDMIDLPMEFSVFHIRYPGEEKGMVTGFIAKVYMSVTGDGLSTLKQLIDAHPKAKFRNEEMEMRHGENFGKVIPAGERYFLSIAGNHNRGANFINLHNEIDERLCNVFDRISLEVETFYFGRYDLKCSSVEDLKQGKNIVILEYNGVGAEPNHIYDCVMSYFRAIREVAMHWRHMYRIGRINHKQSGVPYWKFLPGYRYLRRARRFFKQMHQADLDCRI
ncbi:MAG TPA: hypothetical protein VF145_02125 [Chitinophagaceae bacterium]